MKQRSESRVLPRDVPCDGYKHMFLAAVFVNDFVGDSRGHPKIWQ